ncbi:MAG: MFS transporter [Gammaproteobacteria bacterium]|nr:MFS transporter [Gammaproteobacteria bacterium]
MTMNKRTIYSWALYDWANSAYATTVMAGFFPVFFKSYWSSDLPATESTFYLGLANSIASLFIVLLAPILGAIADCGGKKKGLLILFAFIGILNTALLGIVEQGDWELALLIYIGATLGFSGSIIFNDALIMDVAPESKLDRISALGYALGYAGGGLLFLCNVLMYTQPHWFSLASGVEAVKVSYFTVSVWWLIFSIPLILYVKENKTPAKVSSSNYIVGGFKQLVKTFKEIRSLKVVFTFLLGYWLYIDGVDTVIRMALDYGISLGMNSSDLIVALLITQFVGFPAALMYGFLGERLGVKNGLYIGIMIYLFVIVWAYQMTSIKEFYALAAIVGMVQGGMQALSRSLYARIIPINKSAEFFGFYNMIGKFAAVIGPFMMGSIALMTGSVRQAILSISVLFILGLWFLIKTNIEEGMAKARELEQY